MKILSIFLFALLTFQQVAKAQDLTIATVTRPPFSMVIDGEDTGFSIELWRALADDMGVEYSFRRVDLFPEMLQLVETGAADAATANISITASREEIMDFSQPIFESGLQIMTPSKKRPSQSVLTALFSKDLLTAIALAFAMLFGGGMLMWWFERRAQPYFDRPAKEAMFPSFWWALNLVVNGGFEERVPRTIFGRIFAVTLVVSSLFIVSVFVAKITTAMTIDAIRNNVNSVNDLYGKRVGTIEGSTAATFLESRDLRYLGFDELETLLAAFEDGQLDAVVFDAPILAYYANRSGGKAEMNGAPFQTENYGIALPSNSPLAEPINQSLLRVRENGTYARIYREWFGFTPN